MCGGGIAIGMVRKGEEMYRRNAQGWSKHIDFILLDVVCLVISFILASYIRHHTGPFGNIIYRNLGFALVLIDLVVMMFLNSMHDVLKRGLYEETVQTIKHCVIVFAFATVFMFTLQTGKSYSRIVLFITSLFHILLGLVVRLSWKTFLKKKGNITNSRGTVLAVLDNHSADVMMSRLLKNHFEGYELIGVVLNEGNRDEVCGVPVVAKMKDAPDYISQRWIDSVYTGQCCAGAEAAGGGPRAPTPPPGEGPPAAGPCGASGCSGCWGPERRCREGAWKRRGML